MNAKHGSLFLSRGRALVISPGIDSSLHAHFALQLTYGLERPFRARLCAHDPWIETQAAIFAPNQAHQIDCAGGMLAHLFIELSKQQQAGMTLLQAPYDRAPGFVTVRAAFDAAWQGRLDIDAAEQVQQAWQRCALPDTMFHAAFDDRIASALQWITTHRDMPVSGASLAKRVHLSESRFTHLFRQQTGLSLSRYLLWSRLRDGVEAVARGDNMTTAAHVAGFADLAHMSRTFRNTFDIVPSELQKMTIVFKRRAA